MTADSPLVLLSKLEPISYSIQSFNGYCLTRSQVSQETVKKVWYSHLFKNFPWFVMIHTVNGFRVVNETEIEVLLEIHSFLYDTADVSNFISSSSSFSKPSLYIWKFLVHIMWKPSMQDFKHDHTSMRDECNCPMVNTFFSMTLLGNWDED